MLKKNQELIQPIDPSECTAGGWHWYCDEHDTHGNADSMDEASLVAAAHQKWMKEQEQEDQYCIIWISPVGEQQ